jgi:type I restriction enzyme S subunit
VSFPPYPEYRDSGVEWIGAVPASWKVIALKRALHFLTSGSRGWADHYSDEGALFLRIGNLPRDGLELDLADIQRVAVPPGAEGERTRVQPGDVLFSITAFMGSVAVVPDNLECAYVSQHVALARLRGDLLLPRWVGYATLSTAGKAYLDAQCYGGTKIQLGLDDVANLPVTVPPAEERQALIDFLDHETGKIDALVAEQERLIALLKEKRQAVISHAVTKGLDPNAPMKDSGIAWLGQVPAHWEVKRLKRLVRFVSGGTPSKERQDFWEGDIPWVSPKDMKKWVVTGESDRITAEAVAACNLVLVPRQIVLIVVRGMILAHSFPVALSGRPLTINQDMKAILPESEIAAEYLAYYLAAHRDAVAELIDEAGHGTRVLRMDGFAGFRVTVPTVGEQHQIVEFIDTELVRLDTLTTEAQRAIALLKERRAALISAAVTGKIDVRGLVAPAEAQAA